MKTTTHINRYDIITIIAVIILFAMMVPLKAATGKNAGDGLFEVQVASGELAMFNNEIEKSVEFKAPAVSENFEIMAAETRLDERYDNFETATAIESLDDLNSGIEHSVKYTASPVAD